MGVSIKDCMLHEKNGEQWIAFPGMPYQDKEGTTSYRNIIYFEDKKRGEALKKAALALLREVRGESQAAQEDPFSNNVPF